MQSFSSYARSGIFNGGIRLYIFRSPCLLSYSRRSREFTNSGPRPRSNLRSRPMQGFQLVGRTKIALTNIRINRVQLTVSVSSDCLGWRSTGVKLAASALTAAAAMMSTAIGHDAPPDQTSSAVANIGPKPLKTEAPSW